MKKAVLFSGNSRNSEGIALPLAEAGYDIALWGDPEYARRLSEEHGIRCVSVAPAREGDGVSALVGAGIAANRGCDLFVFDAASDVSRTDILELSEDALADSVDGILKKCVLGLGAAAKWMADNRVRGSNVVITSARGYRARPGDGLYGAAYAAIHRAVESFAVDLAPAGIRVNCVAAGIMDTQNRSARENDWVRDKIPLRRIGTMEDVGNACAYLGSEEASYVTGITIRIDGGLMLATMPDNLADCSARDFVGFDYANLKKTVKDHA